MSQEAKGFAEVHSGLDVMTGTLQHKLLEDIGHSEGCLNRKYAVICHEEYDLPNMTILAHILLHFTCKWMQALAILPLRAE